MPPFISVQNVFLNGFRVSKILSKKISHKGTANERLTCFVRIEKHGHLFYVFQHKVVLYIVRIIIFLCGVTHLFFYHKNRKFIPKKEIDDFENKKVISVSSPINIYSLSYDR